jgi:hypothetical protein
MFRNAGTLIVWQTLFLGCKPMIIDSLRQEHRNIEKLLLETEVNGPSVCSFLNGVSRLRKTGNVSN